MPQSAKTRVYHTNQTTAQFLQKLDEPPFSEEQLSTFSPSDIELLRKNQAELAANPAIGIRRVATEGSQTRRGGKVSKGSSVMTFTLENGEEVTAAITGDPVEYPDGTIAHIVTGAGKGNSDLALVGSRLDNGDEVINTPQDICLLVMRKSDSWDSDFLPDVGVQR